MHAQALNGHTAQLQACLNQVHLCRTQLTKVQQAHHQAIGELRAFLLLKFESQARNINRLRQSAPFAPPPNAGGAPANAPALQAQGFQGGAGIPAGEAAQNHVENGNRGPPRANAVLSKSPKTVHDLWQEY